MKKLLIGMLLAATSSAVAAVATVRQVEPGVRPVYNSGTGVVPAGAQEAMPRARQQLAKDGMLGVGYTPFMFSVVTPVQIPAPEYDVGGLRINLFYGTCVNFDGLDVGLVGVSRNHANGLLANLLVNYAQGDGLGVNVGCVNYYGGDFKGLQIGLANWIDSGDMFQIGLYNGGYDVQGLQIGVINTANKMQGLQIGIVNVISNSDVSFFPVINGYF